MRRVGNTDQWTESVVWRRALNVTFNVMCYVCVCRNRISTIISRMLNAVAAVVIIILNVRCWSWALCVASERCRIFLETSQCTRTQQRGSAEISGLREVKRADFIGYWRRSGLKNPDKPKIFLNKNVGNHSYHQIYPVLEKIRINQMWINRGLLYFALAVISAKLV